MCFSGSTNKSAPAITERAVSARGLPPLGARIADRNACLAWSRGAERAPCAPWKHPVSKSFQHRVHFVHHALKPPAVVGRVCRAHHQHPAASRRTRHLSDRLRVRLTCCARSGAIYVGFASIPRSVIIFTGMCAAASAGILLLTSRWLRFLRERCGTDGFRACRHGFYENPRFLDLPGRFALRHRKPM
jgi:hypothetical protein